MNLILCMMNIYRLCFKLIHSEPPGIFYDLLLFSPFVAFLLHKNKKHQSIGINSSQISEMGTKAINGIFV